MNTSSQTELRCEGVTFASQGAEIFHESAQIGFTTACEYATLLQPPPRFGVSAIRLAAFSAASIWQRDDPMPSVAEFFRVLKHCWRHS